MVINIFSSGIYQRLQLIFTIKLIKTIMPVYIDIKAIYIMYLNK